MRHRSRSTAADSHCTDAELLARIADAHRDALSQLYLRHAAAVKTTAWRVTQDVGEAEDLLHDVFLEVWRSAGDYDPSRGSVRTWLLVRTHSRSVDRRRHLARRVFGDLPPDAVGSTTPSDEHLTLQRALSRLPTRLRELMELGYYAGMSCAEMARALELPLGTVKSRVARALEELRADLLQL